MHWVKVLPIPAGNAWRATLLKDPISTSVVKPPRLHEHCGARTTTHEHNPLHKETSTLIAETPGAAERTPTIVVTVVSSGGYQTCRPGLNNVGGITRHSIMRGAIRHSPGDPFKAPLTGMLINNLFPMPSRGNDGGSPDAAKPAS